MQAAVAELEKCSAQLLNVSKTAGVQLITVVTNVRHNSMHLIICGSVFECIIHLWLQHKPSQPESPPGDNKGDE